MINKVFSSIFDGFFFLFFFKLWSKTVAVGHFLDSSSVSVVSVFDCSDIFTGGGAGSVSGSRRLSALFLPSALRFRWLYRATRFPSWAAGKNLQPDAEALQDFPLNPVRPKSSLNLTVFLILNVFLQTWAAGLFKFSLFVNLGSNVGVSKFSFCVDFGWMWWRSSQLMFWSFVADHHRLTNENRRRRRRSCKIQVELTKTISLLWPWRQERQSRRMEENPWSFLPPSPLWAPLLSRLANRRLPSLFSRLVKRLLLTLTTSTQVWKRKNTWIVSVNL